MNGHVGFGLVEARAALTRDFKREPGGPGEKGAVAAGALCVTTEKLDIRILDWPKACPDVCRLA